MNGGYKATPHVIRRVTTADGKVLYENTYDSPPRVLSEQIAAQMNAMMMGVIDNGTGKSAKIPGWQAAGKTGTTQNSRDALFVGFTSNLTTGVWFGNDDGKPMKKVTGGGLPAKAWKEFMIAAHKGLSPAPLFGNGQLIGDPNGQPMAQTAPDGGQPVTAEVPPPTTIGGIISGVFGGNENANRYPQAPVRQPTATAGNGPIPPADVAEGNGGGYGNVGAARRCRGAANDLLRAAATHHPARSHHGPVRTLRHARCKPDPSMCSAFFQSQNRCPLCGTYSDISRFPDMDGPLSRRPGKIEGNTFVLLDSGLFPALQSRKPLLIYAASPQSRLRNLK